jgi:hypothetical protein
MPPMFAMKVGTLITYNINNFSQSDLKISQSKPSMPPMFAMKVGTFITYNMNNFSRSDFKNQPIKAQSASQTHKCGNWD